MHNDHLSTLFDLVHSLTKGEKRYFKLHARGRSSQTNGSNYIDLFDAIEKQKIFNEEKIRRLNIVKKEHLPMLKNYLYNLILESLRSLRSKGDTVDNKLGRIMDNAGIMRDKGFEKEEMRYLAQAKTLALKYERWGVALDALLAERKIITRKESAAPWKKLDNEIEELLDEVTNLTHYLFLSREVKTLINTSTAHRNDHRKAVKKLCNHPLLKDESKGKSLEAKRGRYLTLSNYYSFLDQHQNSYKFLHKAVDLVESNMQVFGNSGMTYAINLTNLIILQFELGKYGEAFQNIQKYKTFAAQPGPAKTFAFVYSILFETYFYLRIGEFEKGVIVIKGIEKELERGEPSYPTQLHFLYFYMANIYFATRNYRKALQWINKITGQPKTIFREDMQAFARLLQILIHYELNDTDILKHLIISSHRFLFKRKQLFKVEECLLLFMRRLSKKDISGKMLQKEFTVFRNELVQITKNTEEKKALEYVDLISWAESKIEHKTFAEVLKEKIAKRIT